MRIKLLGLLAALALTSCEPPAPVPADYVAAEFTVTAVDPEPYVFVNLKNTETGEEFKNIYVTAYLQRFEAEGNALGKKFVAFYKVEGGEENKPKVVKFHRLYYYISF